MWFTYNCHWQPHSWIFREGERDGKKKKSTQLILLDNLPSSHRGNNFHRVWEGERERVRGSRKRNGERRGGHKLFLCHIHCLHALSKLCVRHWCSSNLYRSSLKYSGFPRLQEEKRYIKIYQKFKELSK